MPDPVVKRVHICKDCQHPMGSFRVFEGSKKETRESRGKIVQTCTNIRNCHYTKFHTDAYQYEDAEALIKRILAWEIGAPIPAKILNAPLCAIQPTSVAIAPGVILWCRGNCTNKSGGKVRGATMCIELKCKSCCVQAAQDAEDDGCNRDPCSPHKVKAVYTTRLPSEPPQAVTPNIRQPQAPIQPSTVFDTNEPHVEDQPEPTAHVQVTAIPGNYGAGTHPVIPVRSIIPPSDSQPTRLVHTPENTSGGGSGRSQNSALRPSISSSTGTSQTAPSTQAVRNGRTKPLAQPLGPNWLKARSEAEVDRQIDEDVKIRRFQIDEQLKRTVDLVIYYKVDTSPVNLPFYVDTYPKLRLESVPLLVKDLKLTDQSLFDHWHNGRWETITFTSNLVVEKGQLPLSRCPGLQDLIGLQPFKKRHGGELVSPLKKVARENDQPGVPSDRHQIQTAAIEETEHLTHNPPSTIDHPSTSNTSTKHGSGLSSSTRTPESETLVNPTTILDCPLTLWDQRWKDIRVMQDDDPNMTEAMAFPHVFGFKYIKSTVSSYKKMWKDAPEDLQRDFIAYGNVRKGSWLNFKTRLRRLDQKPSTLVQLEAERDIQTPVPTQAATIGQLAAPAQTTSNNSDQTQTIIAQVPPPPNPRLRLPLPFPGVGSDIDSDSEIGVELENEPKTVNGALSLHQILQHPKVEHHSPKLNPTTTEPQVDEVDDPSTLCPFCDEKLPEVQSSILTQMRKALEMKTWLDPNPDNSNHRSAINFQVYIAYCTRHMFESKELPQAISNRWPLNPDFKTLYDRVLNQYLSLKSIAESKTNLFLVSAQEYYQGGPTRLEGIDMQFASQRFLESGAGYYGEPGYQIIMSALHNLFPRHAVNLIPIHPLKYNIYLQEVLAYEAATRIILEDLEISYEKATEVFKESCTFSKLMHSSETPEIEAYILDAAERSMKSIEHSASIFRTWGASGSSLSLDKWAEEQVEREQVLRIKQEELDEMELDPFADDEDNLEASKTMKGNGLKNNPFDLTLDD